MTVPDILAPDLRVLFVGINPGLVSEATGHHFARPGNRFWRVIHEAGLTPRRLAPSEQGLLPGLGMGITNLVERATATAAELSTAELRAGGERVVELASRLTPRTVAFLGLTTYRAAYARPGATSGEQRLSTGPARTWVLPNPSGLNAGWSLDRLVDAYADLRRAFWPDGELEPPGITARRDAQAAGPG
jgi:TDG/mug DNA glycosylase family protein